MHHVDTSFTCLCSYYYSIALTLSIDQLSIVGIMPNSSVLIDEGRAAQFSITANGIGISSFNYQWRKRGVNRLPDKVLGEDTTTLTIPKVDGSDEGQYYCIVTNMWNRSVESSNITLTVNSM